MIGYVTIGTHDMETAKAFYAELLGPLGATVQMDFGRFIAFGPKMNQPMLAICTPFNGEPATAGNGNMTALAVGSREKVNEMHAKAMSMGCTDEGAPGARSETFYGAYIRDPEGNKLAFFHIG